MKRFILPALFALGLCLGCQNTERKTVEETILAAQNANHVEWTRFSRIGPRQQVREGWYELYDAQFSIDHGPMIRTQFLVGRINGETQVAIVR